MERIQSFLGAIHTGFRGLDRPAAFHTRGDLTFDELYHRSCALAEMLADGTGPVLVRGHKEVEFLIAYWACLLTARPIIPIEPDTPLQRVVEIAETCETSLLVNTHEDEIDLTQTGLNIWNAVDFDDVQDGFAPVPRADIDPAYILFSSGTTGKPKGIKVSYANLYHFVDWLETDLLTNDDSLAVSGNVRYCFDVSLFEMWFSWTRRVPISTLDLKDFINSRQCIARYSQHNVGLWVSTPSALQFYLRDKKFNGTELPELKTFLFCGEILPKSTAAKLFERFPSVKLINTYGPTECTVAVTSVEIKAEHIATERPLPIGTPRPGCQLVQEGSQISIVGSDVVGLGYVNLPEKQAAVFPEPDKYLTGDIGHLGADGLWYFSGRADREIKLQGIRIDLNEIEAHICDQTGVETVHVEPHLIHNSIRAINAFVCGPKDQGELKNLACASAASLPTWMVPRFWYAYPDFTINRNSKLDRVDFARVAQAEGVRYVYE
ncbi:MAG: AMP-binding protein [Sulfitobacter sp.]